MNIRKMFANTTGCRILLMLMLISSVAVYAIELIYEQVRGNKFFLINLAFWCIFLLCYGRHKGRNTKVSKAAAILLIVIYLAFGVFYTMSLPTYTYYQAVERVKNAQSMDEGVKLISPRRYRTLFTGTTDSGMIPTRYYTMAFEGQKTILYYFDPYLGSFNSVDLQQYGFTLFN